MSKRKTVASPITPVLPQAECPSCAARRAYRTSYRTTPAAKLARKAYQERRAAAKRAANVERVLAEAKTAVTE